MTAKVFYENYVDFEICPLKEYTQKQILNDTHLAMIDFAKYHVELALKSASENFKMKLKNNINDLDMNDEWTEVDKDSVLNSYNLNNIK